MSSARAVPGSRAAAAVLLAAAAAAAAGCDGSSTGGRPAGGGRPPAPPPGPPRFVDVAAAGGVAFESLPRVDAVGYGQGLALADFDGDGDLDLFLPQDRGPCALYRNDGDLRFTEIALAAGVRVSETEAHAKCAAAFDFDGDGAVDLFVGTAGAGNRLFRNRGDGTFEDVSDASAVGGGSDFTVSAAVGDFDGDGRPDLYLCNFVATDYAFPFTWIDGPAPNRLLRNHGDGTFTDVAPLLGVADGASTWAAHWWDMDGDGFQDLLVANDVQFFPSSGPRDRVYRNLGPEAGFAFEDAAAALGLDEAHSGMGFGIGDLDGDGVADVYVTDLGPSELRLRSGAPPWPDLAPALNVAAATNPAGAPAISWAAHVADFDGDGFPDLLVSRGILGSAVPPPGSPFTQVSSLWLNRPAPPGAPAGPLGDRRLVEHAEDAGLLAVPMAGARAMVPADLDGDGDLDLVVSTRVGPVRILRNDAPPPRRWYGVRLRGTASPREGWGALLELRTGDHVLRDALTAGGQPGATLPAERTFRVPPGARGPAVLTVRWPSGRVSDVEARAGQFTVVGEPDPP